MATPWKPQSETVRAACQHGYTCTFKEDKDLIKCCSCHRVARSLSLTSCCGEEYCGQYLQDILTQQQGCPSCSEKFTITPKKKHQMRMPELHVSCGMQQEGCGWEGVLKDLDEHKKECEHAYITCPKERCAVQVRRGELDTHLKSDCPEREYQCPHCNFKDTYRYVTNAHLAECSYFPVRCPNECGVEGERDDMETHQHACPLHYIPCKFSHAGCTEKFRREKEDEHMKGYLQQHLDSLAPLTMEMAKDIRDISERNAQLETRIEKMSADIESLVLQQREQTEQEIILLKERLAEGEERVDSLESQVTNVANQEDISPPEPQGEREYRTLEMKIGCKDEELRQLRDLLTEQKTKSDEQIMQLEKRLAKLEKYVNNPQETIQCRNESQGPANKELPTFTVRNYASLKENRERWNSEEFTVYDENGPTLALVVWPHGQGEGTSTHISVWLENKTASEMDFAPVTVTLTLELVDQSSSDYNPNPIRLTKRCCVYPGSTYEGLSNTFVKHSELRQYLSEDSLKFSITYMQVEPTYPVMHQQD